MDPISNSRSVYRLLATPPPKKKARKFDVLRALDFRDLTGIVERPLWISYCGTASAGFWPAGD
jgi:hypothetical protein